MISQSEFFDESIFILDLANNHFGDLNHAKSVISQHSEVICELGVVGILKFQFRDLDNYISKRALEANGKYVQRFMSTRMDKDEFWELVDFAKLSGFKTMATPFDEVSATWLSELSLEYAKIASASSDDWSLIEAVASQNLPTVASTGGLTQSGVDSLHFALNQRSLDFALMHCVSIYPSPLETLQLNQILNFRSRYLVPIGWSTHEDPKDLLPIAIATSLGSQLFERHIGINSDKYPLNSYSSTPAQIRSWIRKHLETKQALGSVERLPSRPEENDTLLQLKRGWYSKGAKAGEQLGSQNAMLQFPLESGQLSAAETGRFEFTRDVLEGEKIEATRSVNRSGEDPEQGSLINALLFEIRGLLRKANIPLNKEIDVELSHHKGLSRFREFGCTLITVVNRKYAKKIIVLLPRQKNPLHKHSVKEEMFQLIAGDVTLSIEGKAIHMQVGQTIVIPPGAWHKFQSSGGAVIEEVSTTHEVHDSIYEDKEIQASTHRKTKISEPKRFFEWAK